MRDNLNDLITVYMDKTAIEDINLETLKKAVGDIYKTNNYGCISHALINFEYDQEKILKALEVLFENKLDPNYKAKSTKYTFLHLAFYGYTTTDNVDLPYSESFILKLIELAKKYGFDFNLKDNDGDTIIHSCLASEIYEGSVLPIYEAISSSFDLDSKDNDGRNIYEALVYYKKHAGNNIKWKQRLEKDEEQIKRIIELKDIKIEDIEKEIKELITNITNKISGLTIDNLEEENASIDTDLKSLHGLVIKRETYYKREDFKDYTNLYDLLIKTISKIVNDYLEALRNNPSSSSIRFIETIIDKFGLKKEGQELGEIKFDFDEYLKNMVNEMKKSNTVNQIDKTITESSSDETEIISAIDELTSLKDELMSIIDSIIEEKEILNMLRTSVHQEILEDTYDYNNSNKEELNVELERVNTEKQIIKNSILEFINYLLSEGLITLDELKQPKEKTKNKNEK